MVNPCVCIPLLTGVKVLALISLIWSLPFLAEEIFLLAVKGCDGLKKIQERHPILEGIMYSPSHPAPSTLHKESINVTETHDYDNDNIQSSNVNEVEILARGVEGETPFCKLRGAGLMVSGLWVLTWIVDVGLAVILIIGAYKKSARMCLIWLHVRAALVIFRMAFLILYVIAGGYLLHTLPVIVPLLFRIYCLWVVSHYIDELYKEKKAIQRLRGREASPSDVQDLENCSSTNK